MAYITAITVHFGDVDPAHIVYYPVIFHYCHIAFEQFFAEYVGLPYARLLKEERLGFPTVSARADFRKKISYGETVHIEVTVARIGNSSVEFHYCGKDAQGNEYFHAVITVAAVNMDSFAPVPVPEKYARIFSSCQQ
jgi:4-hydroxybenzoyl-CoA thioesterase